MLGRGWSDLQIRLACASYCDGGASDPDLDELINGGRKKWDIPDDEGRAARDAEAAAALLKAKAANGSRPGGPAPYEVFWHGTESDDDLCPWLIKELILETGTGLASGQWGTAKTFSVIDLAGSVMTGLPFAGREVVRQGGVLFVAAEGASQVRIRLKGLVEHKLRVAAIARSILGQPVTVNLDELPFGWIVDCPNLQNDIEFARLMATITQSAADIRARFDLPLVLVVIDTLSAAGNFKDANDAAEGQRVMNRLNEISRVTGGFTLAVDHFGKDKETGTRGTSAKEASADVILALLADRSIAGTLSNTRMALRKLRGGEVGIETPFALAVVEVAPGKTTCVVEWKGSRPATPVQSAARNRWPKSLRIFKRALETAVIEHGKAMQPYGGEGPAVRAVPYEDVRTEFKAAYPAEGDAKDKGNAKRQAFTRAMKQAREKDLIGSREIAGIDYLWLVECDEPNNPNVTA
jgi:hypothetical protein